MADYQADGEPHYSAALHRTAMLACIVLLALVIVGAIHDMLRQSPPVLAVTAVALAVAVAGIGWNCVRPGRYVVDALLLTSAGLAGAVLVGLLPDASGFLVIYIAVLALGMQLPPEAASVAALVILGGVNLSFLLAGQLSVGNIVSNDVGAAFLFSIGVFTRSTRVSQARASAAQARAEQLLARLQAAQTAQAETAVLTERTRVAREVHDILAHALSGLVLALDTAELLGRRGDAGPETMAGILEQVTRAQRIARDGLADTRRAISALRGDELPGPALLGRLVKQTSEATGIHATLTVTGEPRRLSPEVGLALYRTAQEALINSAKYAGRGGTAELRLSYGYGTVALEVEDARSPDAAPPGPAGLTFGGYGLTGIRERAELLGGELAAGPTENGFRVLVRLPAGQADLDLAAVPRDAERRDAEAV
jgi:signal transduction histidine kinase